MPYCNIEAHKNDPDWNYRVDDCPYCQIEVLTKENQRLSEIIALGTRDNPDFGDYSKSSINFMNAWLESKDRIALLETAIVTTLNENRHLADGEDCTLINIKRAVPEWELE